MGGGSNMVSNWFEAERRAKDFRNLKAHDLASPMFMPGIIKESPRPQNHFALPLFHTPS